MNDANQIFNHAKKFVIRNQSFFANKLFRLKVEFKDDQKTTMATDGKRLVVGLPFVQDSQHAKTVFVILHEIGHVIARHHLRRGNMDPELFNIAADHVVNWWVIRCGLTGQVLKVYQSGDRRWLKKLSREEWDRFAEYSHPEYALPSDAIFEPRFIDMTVEEVYQILLEEKMADNRSSPDQSCDNRSGDDQSGDDQSGDDQSDGQPDSGPAWGEVMDMTGDDGEALDEAEKKQAELAELQADMTAESLAKSRGQMPGHISGVIAKLTEPTQDWQDVLRDYLKATMPVDVNFNRLNRMYLHKRMIMPTVDLEGLGNVVIADDVSGSVMDWEFNQFKTETSTICDELLPENIHYIQFTSKVVHADDYDDFEDIGLDRKANGGTRFKPVFDYIDDEMVEPDVLIIFTDGGSNDYPDVEPDYPVIWCSTYDFLGGNPPFGEVIDIKLKR